jgi:hypothetical protein
MPTAVEYAVELALISNPIENGQLLLDRNQVQSLVQNAGDLFGTGSAIYKDFQHIPTPSAQSHVWESNQWEIKHIVPNLQAALADLSSPQPSASSVIIVGLGHTPDHTL